MSDLYVKIRTKRSNNETVYEHVCERNPNPENMDGRPRILWLRPTGAPTHSLNEPRPTWVIEQGYRSRFEIYACPWCYTHLPPPDGKACDCGADEVRESSGHHAFETMHDFLIAGDGYRRVRVKASVLEFMHEKTCPALRLKEKD